MVCRSETDMEILPSGNLAEYPNKINSEQSMY